MQRQEATAAAIIVSVPYRANTGFTFVEPHTFIKNTTNITETQE